MPEYNKKENIIIAVLKHIFVNNWKYKIFAIIGAFLFWLFLSISI